MDTLEEFEPPAATSMTDDGHVPVWRQEIPTAALLEFYTKYVAPEVQTICEEARTNLRKAYTGWRTVEKQSLVIVHDALAGGKAGGKAGGNGEKYWKGWCDLVEINYRTACSIVARAKAAEKKAKQPPEPTVATEPTEPAKPAEPADTSEQATHMHAHTGRSADAQGETPHTQEQTQQQQQRQQHYHDSTARKIELILPADDYTDLVARLEAIGRAEHLANHVEIVRWLVADYEQRHPAPITSAEAGTREEVMA